MSRRLRNVGTAPAAPLDELVADALADIQKFIGSREVIEASSSSDESLPKTPEDNKRARNLRRRALSRARSFVAAAIGAEGSLSALELAAVSKKVNVDYVKLLENFLC